MIRVFNIVTREHLLNNKEGAEKIDSWRDISTQVAVEDGYVEEAIVKLKGLPGSGNLPIAERYVVAVTMISEAL